MWTAGQKDLLAIPQGGPVAQLGERLNGIQEVVGSIPFRSTSSIGTFHGNLQITPGYMLRYLIRENVIPARKERGRWLINSETLRELQTSVAREILSHPLTKDDLTDQLTRSDTRKGVALI